MLVPQQDPRPLPFLVTRRPFSAGKFARDRRVAVYEIIGPLTGPFSRRMGQRRFPCDRYEAKREAECINRVNCVMLIAQVRCYSPRFYI